MRTTTDHRGTRRATAVAVLGVSLTLAAAGTAHATPGTGPARTGLTNEPFTGTVLDNTWVLPAAGANTTCLTASDDRGARPVPGCADPALDAVGSGALRLTDAVNEQVGNVYNSVSLPTSQGLDIRFTAYQYGRDLTTSGGYPAGADGLSFILAAADPDDPAPPATLGAAGGSLGYSASLDRGTPGVSNGYLGFGLDVYGNWTNTGFGGHGCDGAHATGPSNIGVRGPGNGMDGYCVLADTELGEGDLDAAAATTRGAGVPVEVAINPSASPTTTAGGLSVPAKGWAMRATTLHGVAEELSGALPSVDGLEFDPDWYDPATGLPYQLSFGWGSSTGGSNEVHEIAGLQTTTLNGPLPVHQVLLDAGNLNGKFTAGHVNEFIVKPLVSRYGGALTGPVVVTTRVPEELQPKAGSWTSYEGYACTTIDQSVTCRLTSGASYPPGGNLPWVRVPVTVRDGASGPVTTTVTVTSRDGLPASASLTSGIALPPGAPTGVSAVAGAGSVRVSWNPPTSGEPVDRYVVGTAEGQTNCSTRTTSCVLGGEAGRSYTVEVYAITADGATGPAVQVTTDTVTAPAAAPTPPVTPLKLTTTDGDITTAAPGQQITVVGTGFLPYSTASIVIYSTPVTLGTVTVDMDGGFTKTVTVPADLEPGAHSLVAYGVDPDGDERSMRMDVQVAAATSATGDAAAPSSAAPAAAPAKATGGKTLAFTGATVLPYLGGGAVLVAVGLGLMIGTRRRRAGAAE